jgi:hypothetical protein
MLGPRNIFVPLRPEHADLLFVMSQREFRHPKEQAQMLLAKALEKEATEDDRTKAAERKAWREQVISDESIADAIEDET